MTQILYDKSENFLTFESFEEPQSFHDFVEQLAVSKWEMNKYINFAAYIITQVYVFQELQSNTQFNHNSLVQFIL